MTLTYFATSSLRLYATPEDLPPQLRSYCHASADLPGMMIFHHPMLVSLMPLAFPAAIETVIALRREQARSFLDRGHLQSFLFRHERPYRADALLDLLEDGWFENGRHNARAAARFWQAAAYVWTDCEADELDPLWTRLMDAPVRCRAFMSGSRGRRALRALPDPMRLYRGIQAEDQSAALDRATWGWSWTTDRSVALRFARRYLSAPERSFVAEATVPRARIAAYLTGRNESEALVEPASIPDEIIILTEVRCRRSGWGARSRVPQDG